jgi:predicted Zn-dependent peptidase
VVLSGLAFLLVSGGAIAQDLEGRVTRLTLDNGMRFLIMPRGTAPVFSAVLRYRVGSVDDPSGSTGMAHLFEHMAFKGTTLIGVRDAVAEAKILEAIDRVVRDLHAELDREGGGEPERLETLRREMQELTQRHADLVVKDEFSQILATNGAQGLNAGTGSDLTMYVMSLPANRLELWCLMESARLRDLVVREFYSERDVVKEERRMRVDNHPDGKLYEQLLLTAYQAHPYRISVGGWMTDLERMHRARALEFRKRYYVSNNAVGALVGDVDPETATRLIRKYFGSLPSGPTPAGPTLKEPPQGGERRVTVEFDAEPQLMIAFHKPSMPHPDDTIFDVIDSLLTSGRTSRLFRSLVMESRLASNVATFEAPGERYPSLFIITAEPRAPHTPADVEAAILKELRKLSEELVEERELEKIRNQVEASFLYALRSNRGLSSQLSYFEIMTGDWKALIEYQRALAEVTPTQVRDVAARTFIASNRTVALLTSPAGAR